MNKLYRPGIALIGLVAAGTLAWPLATAGHGIVGPGGAACGVFAGTASILLMVQPLSRSRPAILGVAALLAMAPYASFLIGSVLSSNVQDGLDPALSRSTVSLLAFLASIGAVAGFLLALVRTLQIRSAGHHRSADAGS